MIFYFSGTGNSAAAAGQLLSPGEKLISMAEANRAEAFVYSPEEDENVGFVFPVYFYGLPDTVRRFAQNVIFDRQPQYVYAVITCGGSIAGAGDLLKKALMARGIELRAVYTVKMPDNYVLLYDVTTEAQEKPILAAAEQSFARIRESVALRRFTGADVGVAARAQTAAIYPFYDLTRKTAKFHAGDTCIGCGKCARNCPAGAIAIRDGKPVWIKECCDHCLRCLGCSSIQFGKRTVARYRYLHPDLRQK